MQKIEVDGQTYYYINDNFVDESFLVVPDNVKKKLIPKVFESVDYKNLSPEDLMLLIKKAKRVCAYAYVIKVATFGLDKNIDDAWWAIRVLPILTSSLREMGKPENAIEVAKHYTSLIRCSSPQLCTSLASAYCDIGDYERAKKFADRAYAMQGGGQGYKNELTLVYKRIDKETGNKRFD